MFLFYFSISLAILSTLFYHIFQKSTSTTANPALTFIVTYSVSLVLCLILLIFLPLNEGLREGIRQLNWASFALAFALVGLEVGFLLAYRAGWNIALAAIIVNVAATALLVPIGLIFYREKLSLVNILGIVVCIVGLIMVNYKK